MLKKFESVFQLKISLFFIRFHLSFQCFVTLDFSVRPLIGWREFHDLFKSRYVSSLKVKIGVSCAHPSKYLVKISSFSASILALKPGFSSAIL
jgi:hypothetical protein